MKVPAADFKLNWHIAPPPSTKVTLQLKHALHLTLANSDGEIKQLFTPRIISPLHKHCEEITWGKHTDTGLYFVVCESQAIMLLLAYNTSQFLLCNI